MRATNILILICFLVSLYSWTSNPTFVEDNLVFSLKNMVEGRIWTLVTGIFVHASLLHLLGNMVFLYVFGNTLESVTDSKRMLSAFFLGGLLSFPLSLPFFPPDATFVGASAAIFTLTAVVMLIKPLRFSWLLLMPVGLVAILYFLYNGLAVYYNLQSNVAYVSHIIGFALGLPLGIAWSTRWKRNLLISIGLLAAYFIILYLVMQFALPYLARSGIA
jgi:membrane associated rhomboid family serine protease